MTPGRLILIANNCFSLSIYPTQTLCLLKIENKVSGGSQKKVAYQKVSGFYVVILQPKSAFFAFHYIIPVYLFLN